MIELMMVFRHQYNNGCVIYRAGVHTLETAEEKI
jgi:hypothetical protein